MNKNKFKSNSVLIILLLSIFSFNSLSTQSATTTFSQQSINELNKLIIRFENGFLNFTEKIALLLKKFEAQINPKTLEALKLPLRLFAENMQKNKNRNYRQFVQLQAAQGKKPPFHKFEDNSIFYYDFLPLPFSNYALIGFSMHTRILYINPNYNPNSNFDNLIVFHEMVHVHQDTVLRNHLKAMGEKGEQALTRYIELSIKGIKDPDLEPVAYAKQLELLNFLLKGELRKIIKTQNEIPLMQIAKLFNVNSQQKLYGLKELLKYAVFYFGQDCWIYSYTKEYRAAILQDYIRLGYKFYESENKFIKPDSTNQQNQNRTNERNETPSDANRSSNRSNSNNDNDAIIQID